MVKLKKNTFKRTESEEIALNNVISEYVTLKSPSKGTKKRKI